MKSFRHQNLMLLEVEREKMYIDSLTTREKNCENKHSIDWLVHSWLAPFGMVWFTLEINCISREN